MTVNAGDAQERFATNRVNTHSQSCVQEGKQKYLKMGTLKTDKCGEPLDTPSEACKSSKEKSKKADEDEVLI